MSLSGLDTPALEGAYQAVLEKGGWLLLHYTARDAIDVLATGAKGLAEMRESAEAHYNDDSGSVPSPLFGMVQFRRRKVLIKLVMEGTSRLIQARAQVHWIAITNRLPNHDATYEPTHPDQLNETALTAHIELHSSRSIPNSGKKALDGIEEGPEELEAKRKSLAASEGSDARAVTYDKHPATTQRPEEAPATPSIPNVSITNPPTQALQGQNKHDEDAGYSGSLNLSGDYSFLDSDRRMSSQSARPTAPDFYGTSLNSSFLYKPKPKLGPRPSTEKRPGSSKSSSVGRAVAALPAGMRSTRPSSISRPMSRDSTYSVKSLKSVIDKLPPPPPIPESSQMPLYIPRPTSSSGSVRSLPASLPKSGAMSKEKQRLMRFREMYKQKEARASSKHAALRSESAVQEESTPASVKKQENAPKAEDPFTEEKEPEAEDESAIRKQQEALDCQVGSDKFDHPKPAQDEKQSSDIRPRKSLDSGDHMKANASGSGNGEDQDGPKPTEGHESPELPHKESSKSGDDDCSSRAEDEARAVDQAGTANSKTTDNETETVEHVAQTPTTDENHTILESPSSVQESSATGRISTRPTSVSDVSEPPYSDTHSLKLSQRAQKTDSMSTVIAEPRLPRLHGQQDLIAAEVPEHSTKASDTPAVETPKLADGFSDENATPIAVSPLPPQDRPASVSSLSHVNGRRRAPAPLSTDMGASTSSIEYDDDLMDELHDAEVQEATPVSVSKSPITPFFPRQPSTSSFRAVSSPQVPSPQTKDIKPAEPNSPASPAQSISRLRSISKTSASPVSPTPHNSGETVSVAKKKVGGGIAAKIADLQRNFSRNTSASSATLPPTGRIALRASSITSVSNNSQIPRSQPNTPPVPQPQPKAPQVPPHPQPKTPQTSHPQRLSSLGSLMSDEDTSFHKTPSPSSKTLASRFSYIKGHTPAPSHVTVTPKTDSVSVRATIVRPAERKITGTGIISPTSFSPLESQTSPVAASHQRARSSVSAKMYHPSARSSSVSSIRSASASPTSEQREFLGLPRLSIDSGWRPFRARRLSDAKSPTLGFLPRSMSNSSLDTAASGDSINTEKKPSRTSRLLKRMSSSISSITNTSRMQLGTLNEKASTEEELERSERSRPKATVVGDMNLQFPDTLLWKRRWVEIDDHGYIILKPTGGNERMNGVVRRYHLSEFHAPFAPDLERQEMPNSIILDFRDGRTLQCALQSPIAQQQILKTLLDAHHGWMS